MFGQRTVDPGPLDVQPHLQWHVQHALLLRQVRRLQCLHAVECPSRADEMPGAKVCRRFANRPALLADGAACTHFSWNLKQQSVTHSGRLEFVWPDKSLPAYFDDQRCLGKHVIAVVFHERRSFTINKRIKEC